MTNEPKISIESTPVSDFEITAIHAFFRTATAAPITENTDIRLFHMGVNAVQQYQLLELESAVHTLRNSILRIASDIEQEQNYDIGALDYYNRSVSEIGTIGEVTISFISQTAMHCKQIGSLVKRITSSRSTVQDSAKDTLASCISELTKQFRPEDGRKPIALQLIELSKVEDDDEHEQMKAVIAAELDQVKEQINECKDQLDKLLGEIRLTLSELRDISVNIQHSMSDGDGVATENLINSAGVHVDGTIT